MQTAPTIVTSGLCKVYRDRAVLDHVALELSAGTVTALTGKSGAGKTTLLRLIAGLDAADAGDIHIAGKLATSGKSILCPPYARGVGMVFQQPALWPHMNVRDHAQFGLENPRDTERVDEVLFLLGIVHLARAYPGQLSGGEASRVALARALTPSPHCLLLDEPFAHLHGSLRRDLAETIREATRTSGAATLIVTHTPDDLSGIAARRLHLEEGRLT